MSSPAPPSGKLVRGGLPTSPSSGSRRPNSSLTRRLTLRQISSRSGGPLRPRLPHCGSLSDMEDQRRPAAGGGECELWQREQLLRARYAVAARYGIFLAARGNRSVSAAANSGTPAPVSALK